eukprot:152502_1
MSQDLKWHTFSSSPFSLFTTIFAINKDEFVTVSATSIFIFNQKKDEWNTIFNYEADFGNQLAYDEANQALYLYDRNYQLLRFDIKSRKLHVLNMETTTFGISQWMFAEKKLLKMDMDILFVYDDIMKEFQRINEHNAQIRLFVCNRSPLIYLKSQKRLLSFSSSFQDQNGVYDFD